MVVSSSGSEEILQVSIRGLVGDYSYCLACACATDLFEQNGEKFQQPLFRPEFQFQWDLFINQLKQQEAGEMWAFSDTVVVYVNGRILGGCDEFVDWAKTQFGREDFRPLPLYGSLTAESYKQLVTEKQRTFVFFDISIGDSSVGRLLIELFSDILPKTCKNFRALCTGEEGTSEISQHELCYKGSKFHRIVPNGWIQGGDIYEGRGNGGESTYGLQFDDESYAVNHDSRGIIGMANTGRHTNGSQFYITLAPSKWMDGKFVAFGRIVEGTATLAQMEEVETMNERPNYAITINDCGVFSPCEKFNSPTSAAPAPALAPPQIHNGADRENGVGEHEAVTGNISNGQGEKSTESQIIDDQIANLESETN